MPCCIIGRKSPQFRYVPVTKLGHFVTSPAITRSPGPQREQAELPEEEVIPTDFIIIGTVSAFRELEADNMDDFYNEYAAFAAKVHPPTSPEYTREEFKNEIAGWTRLKTFTIPFLVGLYEYALVPVELAQNIQFPTSFGTVLVQETGDLLAARTNRDGYYLVTTILCEDGPDYYDCASDYDKGFYDVESGEELSYSLEPKSSGKRIDTVTFKLIQELDQ